MRRHSSSIPYCNFKHCFQNSFISSTLIEWNNLDLDIRNFESSALKQRILTLKDPLEIVPLIVTTLKLTARQRRGSSHLGIHGFYLSFRDILTTIHNLLHCLNFSSERKSEPLK